MQLLISLKDFFFSGNGHVLRIMLSLRDLSIMIGGAKLWWQSILKSWWSKQHGLYFALTVCLLGVTLSHLVFTWGMVRE